MCLGCIGHLPGERQDNAEPCQTLSRWREKHLGIFQTLKHFEPIHPKDRRQTHCGGLLGLETYLLGFVPLQVDEVTCTSVLKIQRWKWVWGSGGDGDAAS